MISQILAGFAAAFAWPVLLLFVVFSRNPCRIYRYAGESELIFGLRATLVYDEVDVFSEEVARIFTLVSERRVGFGALRVEVV